MKKTLILALALAAGTACASPYYLPTGRYTDDLPARRSVDIPGSEYACPPVIVPPVIYENVATEKRYGIEIGASYTYMTTSILKGTYDMDHVGLDITGLYNIDEHWTATLRISWNTGFDFCLDEGEVWKAHVHNCDIAPGIRYTTSIGENMAWYVGANIGLGYTGGTEDWPAEYGVDRDVMGEFGLTYYAETGIRYNVTKSFYVFGAAHFWGTTSTPENGDRQKGVGVRAGIGVSF